MREINELKRNDDKPVQARPSKEMLMLLDIFDTMIEGKRFSEVDSSKQMYLLACQGKIEDMKNGYFTENDVNFIRGSIDNLMEMCIKVNIEFDKILFGKKGE